MEEAFAVRMLLGLLPFALRRRSWRCSRERRSKEALPVPLREEGERDTALRGRGEARAAASSSCVCVCAHVCVCMCVCVSVCVRVCV